MIYENILKTIGDTPIVKLNRISQGLPFPLYAKVEYIKNWPEKKPVKGVLLANERYFYVATISADLVAGRY
jgi:hypothetical protein